MSGVTNRELPIAEALKNLVGRRFNKETLEAKLSEIFGIKAKVEDISKDDDELSDFNYLTAFDNKDKGIYGYADIYFLPMRRTGFDGATFYVTEVGYEFE
jgi:hypothetical protein